MRAQSQFFRTYDTPKKEFQKVQNEPLTTVPQGFEEDEMVRGLLMPSARITIEDEDPDARIFTIEDRKRMSDYKARLVTQLNQQTDGLDEINEGIEIEDENPIQEQPLKLKSQSDLSALEETLIRKKDLSLNLSEIQKR